MDKDLLPAIQRYISKRIEYTYNLAKIDGVQFLILSGEFGLITEGTLIPYYDHLLLPDEVVSAMPLLVQQLIEQKVEELTFFCNDPETEPTIKPYIDLIQLACQQHKTILNFHQFPCRIED